MFKYLGVTRVRVLARVLALALTVLLAGCGGASSNGIATKTPREILAASNAAAASASSVHVLSNITQGRLSSVLNTELASNGGRARVSFFGLNYELLRIGEVLYFKGSPGFYKELGGVVARAAAKLPAGTWLKTSVSAGPLAQLATVTYLSRQLNVILDATNPLTTTGRTTTVNGQQAIGLKETAKLYTAARYIATTGKPYPIEILKHGRETGQTTFSDWNKPISLTPPANAIAIK